MNVLALDTCADQCAAAILTDSGAVFCHSKEMTRGHAEAIPAIVASVLEQASLAYGNLTQLVVTVGPGSFSGVRVGLSLARGLAVVLEIPVLGISSLQAIAESQAKSSVPRGSLVAIDARRGEVYFQAFNADKKALCQPMALPVEAAYDSVCEMIDTSITDYRLIGGGAELLARSNPEFEAILDRDAATQPDLEHLCRLSVDLDPACYIAKPIYVRPPDAKPMRLANTVARA